MTIKNRIASGFVSASMIATLLSPAAMAADLEISGNGNKSDNTIKVTNSSTTVVSQNNVVNANVNVNSKANTGNLKANGNTGGDVDQKTGDAKSTVLVTVLGGNNTATLPDDCGCPDDTDVLISGNGSKSDNTVKLKNLKTLVASQLAKVKATVTVNSKAKTGKLKANNNTNATIDQLTGDAQSKVDVAIVGGHNTLQ